MPRLYSKGFCVTERSGQALCRSHWCHTRVRYGFQSLFVLLFQKSGFSANYNCGMEDIVGRRGGLKELDLSLYKVSFNM